ncbi:asparagine synthase (glutamine-hydrolyzing) [Aliarcobacter cryaerophilus]|uniref:asparagine synthase (glutamine-hydrolyzing) n=1 Tax=Aliarcobacter cryaerophilus TaxID=28198 RepID=UPI0021B64D4D|nr:asparagine synthase (glutamine-hydrolyzing) [Aliarcobacter cryaerophilus]MCT7460917.1 asparagine synthase (glutamine-hydrolyzing) [Aliarcobacter cryaerophilus]
MCGIAGFCDFSKQLGKSDLINMTDILYRRGPNDSGYSLYETDYSNIGLGHRRLSILDLSTHGHQPMKFENLEIAYNGEVYNFKEIRNELKLSGYNFESDSDTEVILKSFHKWGKNCVEKFRGMWAFAIYDTLKEELILCRDRMGVKPLYYYLDDNQILFASELKSFHHINSFKKKEDTQSLYYYFKYGYIPTPHTIFENTYKLEAGTFLIIDKNFDISKEVYWNPADFSYDGYKNISIPNNENKLINQLEEILTESFNLRMVSDVPVGMFLSGGIDSSLVTAILQKNSSTKLNTFTIGFNEKETNEAVWAKKVADYLGTNHTELYINPQDAFDNITKLPDMFDEPFADNSSIPTFMVSELAKKDVTVSLSADGGDELFGGYSNYQPTLKLHKILQNIPFGLRKVLYSILNTNGIENFITELKFLQNKPNVNDKYTKLKNSMLSNNILEIFDQSKSYWSEETLNKLFKFNVSNKTIYETDLKYNDLLNLVFLYDQKTYMLDDILTKVDRATMFNSLEGREPFLDNKIVEFALSLPSKWKIKDGQNKYLLKQILYKYLPKDLIDRPKQGFGMPIQQWFRKDLKPLYEHYLSKNKLDETGHFNSTYIEQELKEYFKGKNTNSNKFWLILVYMQWREKWM